MFIITILLSVFMMEERGYFIYCAQGQDEHLTCGSEVYKVNKDTCYTLAIPCTAQDKITLRTPKMSKVEVEKEPVNSGEMPIKEFRYTNLFQESPQQMTVNNCRMFYSECATDCRMDKSMRLFISCRDTCKQEFYGCVRAG